MKMRKLLSRKMRRKSPNVFPLILEAHKGSGDQKPLHETSGVLVLGSFRAQASKP